MQIPDQPDYEMTHLVHFQSFMVPSHILTMSNSANVCVQFYFHLNRLNEVRRTDMKHNKNTLAGAHPNGTGIHLLTHIPEKLMTPFFSSC